MGSTEKKAVDVTEKKIVLIGIGNCGNQVVNLGEKKYPELFDCIYINTSDSDLSMVDTNGDGMKFKIGVNADYEVEGSGKNRAKMKQYLKDDMETIIKDERFRDMVINKKFGFVIVSAAGGTGSGAGPVFTSIMQKAFPDTTFKLTGVLPRLNSSLLELGNSLEFLDELYHKMPAGTSYMMYDNETRANLPITTGLTDVNDNIIEDIRVFTGIDNYPTPYESIDDADMETILATGGRTLVVRIPADKLTEKCIEDGKLDDTIIKAIKSSSHAEIDRNKKVVRWGIITYFTEAVNRLYNPILPGLKEFLGNPIEIFNHNAVNPGSEKLNFMYVIVSGLSPINDRVTKISDRVKELNDEITKTKEAGYVLDGDKSISSMIADLRKDDTDANADQKFTIEDAFSNFM